MFKKNNLVGLRRKFLSTAIALATTMITTCSLPVMGAFGLPADVELSNNFEIAPSILRVLSPDITSQDSKGIITDDLYLEWTAVPTTNEYNVLVTDEKGNTKVFNTTDNFYTITKDNFEVGQVYEIHVEGTIGSGILKEGKGIKILFADENYKGTGSVEYDVSFEKEKPITLGVKKEEIPITIGRSVNELPKITEEEYFVVNDALASVGKDINKIDYMTQKQEVVEDTITVSKEIYVKDIPKDEKWARVFPDGHSYTSSSEAYSHIVEVKIPAWNIDSNGNKYATTYSLEVNENLAEEVVQIFTEIFNDPEQFPIKCIGGWRWSYLSSGNLSQHNYGTCIDINPDENYMIRANGTIEYPGFWRPYDNPYSITPDGSVIRVFRKYGWGWGGADWKSSRDYMHLTYLGG